MNYHVQVQNNNVTLAQFFANIRWACKQKGISFDLDRELFENPVGPSSSSYSVIDGKKHCHFAYYQTTTHLRRKTASYQTAEGFTRYYPTEEFEEYEKTELVRFDQIVEEETPCKSEICRNLPLDYQTYILNWDGTCYNEIIEFTFDDEKKGHGYYYQANKDQ